MHAHVIGDLHGFYEVYKSLLIQNEIIDAELNWIAGDDQLWLIGDIFDRGPESLACVDLTMKLQQQALLSGGLVQCLMGNHELMFLAACQFKQDASQSEAVKTQWIRWGGQAQEYDLVTDKHIEWLKALPAMALVSDRLLIHSDNLSYVNCGMNINAVNNFYLKLVESKRFDEWEMALRGISDRGAFDLGISGPKQAGLMLKMYGGEELVHGHTPIPTVVDVRAEDVDQPRIYANGQCCNVDGGIYMGSPGFIYRFEL